MGTTRKAKVYKHNKYGSLVCEHASVICKVRVKDMFADRFSNMHVVLENIRSQLRDKLPCFHHFKNSPKHVNYV